MNRQNTKGQTPVDTYILKEIEPDPDAILFEDGSIYCPEWGN